MDITGDANVSRLFSLGTGLFAGGKTNQALDSLDNVSSTVRRLDNLDNVTDVTKTLDDVTIKQPQKLKSVESYSNWDDMKSAHKGMVTKFVQNNKPKGSPVPKEWFEKGGSLTIETLDDGTQIWRYTSLAGDTVPYIDGKIRFPDEYLHANKKIREFSIGEFTGNREIDKKLALEYLNKYGYDRIPDGYVLHHDIENGMMQLVRADIHGTFNHYGGYYYNK